MSKPAPKRRAAASVRSLSPSRLKEPSNGFLVVYRLAATALVFLGAVISAGLAWDTADLLQALMVIINIPVIVILAKPAIAALRDYEWQKRKGKLPAYRGDANGVKGTDFWQSV